jgi:hypothetical protein
MFWSIQGEKQQKAWSEFWFLNTLSEVLENILNRYADWSTIQFDKNKKLYIFESTNRQQAILLASYGA